MGEQTIMKDDNQVACTEDEPTHPLWKIMLSHGPDQAAAKAGSPLMSSMRKAIGEGLNAALVSENHAERVQAEDELLADSLATTTLFIKQVEAKMATLAGGKEDPEMHTFGKLSAIREGLERQAQSAIRLRRALSKPGPVNLKVTGTGPQQVNVGAPPPEKPRTI